MPSASIGFPIPGRSIFSEVDMSKGRYVSTVPRMHRPALREKPCKEQVWSPAISTADFGRHWVEGLCTSAGGRIKLG